MYWTTMTHYLIIYSWLLLLFIQTSQACYSSSAQVVRTDMREIKTSSYLRRQKFECNWVIIAPENLLVRFRLTHYRLAQPGDYIVIHDGRNESAVVLKNFTSKVSWKWWTSSGRFLRVKLVRNNLDKVIGNYGFRMALKFVTQTVACSSSTPESVTTDREPITSPFYADHYPNNQECKWLITAPKGKLVQFRITQFYLDQPGDSIVIRDGINEGAVVLNTNSIDAIHRKVPSSDRYLWVKFKSDRIHTNLGFKISFKFIPKPKACSSSSPQVVTTDEMPITSPFYPFYYPYNQECTWLITAPQDKLVQFRLTAYYMAQPGDYVVVRDGLNESAVVLKNFSRGAYYKYMTSSNRFLWIQFKSDRVDVNLGFSIALKFVPKLRACSLSSPQKLMNDTLTITSPFYPSYYPNNQECTWLIVAPKGKSVRFKLTEYYLAQPGDYLVVRDGLNEHARVLTNFSSKSSFKNRLWISAGKYLWIKFSSDKEKSNKGFEISYWFGDVPQGSSPRPSGSLLPSSPSSSESPSRFASDNINFSTQTIDAVGDVVPTPSSSESPPRFSFDKAAALNSNKVQQSIVIGVSLGIGILVLLVIVFLLYMVIRKRKRDTQNRVLTSKDPWEVSSDQVEVQEEIGHGAFGKVWKARMNRTLIETDRTDAEKCKTLKDQQDRDMIVAVKTLLDGASEDEKKEFLCEIEFMKNVGYHKNIISMVACCTKSEKVFLVVEFAMHGDLLNLLRAKRMKTYIKFRPTAEQSSSYSGSEDTQNVESLLEELMCFSWQIAQGMEYLSSKGIVHRDLAARNILVADGLVAKVADFGLSRHVTYTSLVYQAQKSRKLPLKWMSPEALEDQIFTSKSDIWSYGVVIWEIFSLGKHPYSTICNQHLLASLKRGIRMDKPNLCPEDMYTLMEDCWQEHAQDRPSFNDVIQRVETQMTRDKPYVEIMEIGEEDDGYLKPLMISDPESDASDMV